MDALTEAIVRLLRRMDKLEERLGRLEAAQGIAPAVEPETQTPPPVEQPPEPEPAVAPVAPAQPESTRELETRVGLTWINRVGVFTLVCAVAFFFKYAVDNQWIGEAGRVVLGVIAGFALLGLAEFMWRRGHRIYAQGITGAGIAILYLSFYASFGFYHLLGQGFAFLLMALTTAMAGTLAIRYNAAAISALGLVGGYLTPVLLTTGVDRPWAFFSYLMLLNAGTVTVARWRRWRPLPFAAFAGTTILYVAWFAEHFGSQKQLVATVWALAFYALFALADSAVIFFASQVLAAIAITAIWSAPDSAYLWLALILAAAGLAISEWRVWPTAAVAAFGAFWSCFAVWQTDLYAPYELGGISLALTAGFLLFFGWAAWRVLVRRIPARTQDLTIIALNGAAYFAICYHLLHPSYAAYLGLFAAALAAPHLALGIQLWKAQDPATRDLRPVLLYVGVAVAFLTLAAPIQFSGYRITMAWAVEAAALSWIGARTGSRRLLYSAALVFLLVLVRLYSIDAWIYLGVTSYRVIANARFLTFLVSAICLWLNARWTVTTGPRPAALASYVAGHAVLLWALVLETLGWAGRTVQGGNFSNLAIVAVTVLLAAYSVALVALGVLTRRSADRILGLGLMGVVVLKLYLFDVWQLQRIYRVAAFSCLGVLLLVTSYLYSRYKTGIEITVRFLLNVKRAG
jgi:hypothetical protein